jgi:transposase
MSYIIEQKIGNAIYLYEVESYWNAQKKQPRQRRRYIGKKDPQTGQIVTPRKSIFPKMARDYGHIYLLNRLSQTIGLTSCLKSAFPESWQILLHLAFFQVLEAKPLYLHKSWVESCYVPEQLGKSTQEISKLLSGLGQADRQRQDFHRKWIKRQGKMKGIWLDITSLSSYGNGNDFLEWGYNRDHETLPQMNIGMLTGSTSELPFYYQVYPGSIADVSTLANSLQMAETLGMAVETLILDCGFHSAENIRQLIAHRLNFIIPLPLTLNKANQLLTQSKRALTSPLNHFCYQGRVIFYWKGKYLLEKTELVTYVYLDEKRRAEEMEHFLTRLDELKRIVESKPFKHLLQVKQFLEACWKGSTKWFQINLDQQGRVTLQKKCNALSLRMNRMGKMILITNTDLGYEETLEWYRRRDEVEKLFRTLKSSLQGKRLRTHSRTTTEGRLFIIFLALILYTAVLKRLKQQGLLQKYSTSEIFLELRKIKAITLSNNKTILSEITKKQRELFQKLDIPIPVAPSY